VQIHNHVIQKAKDVIMKMHAHATHLMDSYSEQYLLDETYDEWGVYIRYRIPPLNQSDVDSSRWDYRLEGRAAFVDDEECQVSNIKWHIIIEAI
jgi:hypothetical protein